MSLASLARTGAARVRSGAALVGARSLLAARALGGLARDVLEFGLPQRCPGCGASAEAERLLCERCRGAILGLDTALCARCLRLEREPSGCLRHAGYRVHAAWIYDERAARLVHALKFEGRPRLARSLGETLAAAVPSGWQADLVLEVPLHPVRLRERGYNQAAALAEALARALAVPRLEGSLERVRATRPQVGLGARARRAHLTGAFRARHPERLAGRRVLIVDDVITTGATLECCLETLERAGASAAGVALAWAS